MLRTIVLIFFFTFSIGHSYAQKKKDKEVKIKDYKEDFSSFRPNYDSGEKKQVANVVVVEPPLPKNHINLFLQEKMDSVHAYNEKIVSAEGFRILVYTGSSSEEARTQRNNVFDVLPNDNSYTDWKPPIFKVKVGDYIDKLEAYYAYAKLIKVFPNAIVVPDKINIVREKK